MNIGLKNQTGFMVGIDPEAPKVDDNQCSKMLIIRVAKKGESPTVFVD